MTTKQITVKPEQKTDVPTIISDIVLNGDLSKLNAEQRVVYYNKFCESLGLNPLTKPFEFLTLNGKVVLYARKDATEQLRKINGVSVEDMDQQIMSDIVVVKVKVKDKTGRFDIATGAVNVANLKGDALANAIMKAETKAKRRATLSICGLGVLDETEIETIPGAHAAGPEIKPIETPKLQEPVRQQGNFSAAATFISHADEKGLDAALDRLRERLWKPQELQRLEEMIKVRRGEIKEKQNEN